MVLVRFFAKPVVPSPKNSRVFLHKCDCSVPLFIRFTALKHVAFLGSESWWVWIFMVQLWGMWVNITICCKVMLMFGSSPVCSTWIPNPIPNVDVRIFQLNLEWTCHVNHCSFADSQKWTSAKFNATRDFERFLKCTDITNTLPWGHNGSVEIITKRTTKTYENYISLENNVSIFALMRPCKKASLEATKIAQASQTRFGCHFCSFSFSSWLVEL